MISSNRSLTATLKQRVAGASVHLRQVPRPPRDAFWAHSYYTDGVTLFRLVGWLGRSVNAALVEFEDCRSLETILIRIDERATPSLWPLPHLA